MAWHLGGNMDPRLEGRMVSWSSGLNNWFLRHPFRGPVIFFIVGGIVLGLSLIPSEDMLYVLAIPPFLLGLFLLIYALVRRAVESPANKDTSPVDEPPEEYMKVDEQAREQAFSSWRRRTRQAIHRRKNPGE